MKISSLTRQWPAAMMVAAALFSHNALAVTERPAQGGEAKHGIAWISGSSEAVVQKAFADAKKGNKPVLLYWGAIWCPPCNQLKATVFNRQDFIALSRSVVPVYLDGDLPGAQKLGSRYKVVGYPTMIVFSPTGIELTRLSSGADEQQIVDSLRVALAGGRSVKQILADALAGKPLTHSEWRALAFYSWHDAMQVLPESGTLAKNDQSKVSISQLGSTLRDLSERARESDPESSLRLWLRSYAIADKSECADRLGDIARLNALLASPEQVRQQAVMLISASRPLVLALSDALSPARELLVKSLEETLLRLQGDATLSRADRIEALGARVELARIEADEKEVRVMLSPTLLDEVRSFSRRLDKEVTNGYERQAVVTSAGYVLGRAGLWNESDSLLKAGLGKSHSPYYLMSQLGSNARELGENGKALDWYERAYKESVGPATRLQWGASYLGALVDLSPESHVRVDAAVSALLADAAKDKGAMYERSRRSLQRMVGHLNRWAEVTANAEMPPLFRQRFLDYCASVPESDEQRSRCLALWP